MRIGDALFRAKVAVEASTAGARPVAARYRLEAAVVGRWRDELADALARLLRRGGLWDSPPLPHTETPP